MSNSEHLATVMVNAFIDAVDRGVDLVPVVADSTSTAKIAPFIKRFPAGWSTSASPSRRWLALPPAALGVKWP